MSNKKKIIEEEKPGWYILPLFREHRSPFDKIYCCIFYLGVISISYCISFALINGIMNLLVKKII